ncbi:unnamed protein product [Ceratitis capitata]|uniref:(Mediterranean fruit fly) hypothetical protein n=1 Tax=Ceratitis capitata TaxID=7213 RepID=A0A811VBM3_CERCA|nr:unnamed protein product [Ceratitis capitata]
MYAQKLFLTTEIYLSSHTAPQLVKRKESTEAISSKTFQETPKEKGKNQQMSKAKKRNSITMKWHYFNHHGEMD